jgi:WD40 repeat protein
MGTVHWAFLCCFLLISSHISANVCHNSHGNANPTLEKNSIKKMAFSCAWRQLLFSHSGSKKTFMNWYLRGGSQLSYKSDEASDCNELDGLIEDVISSEQMLEIRSNPMLNISLNISLLNGTDLESLLRQYKKDTSNKVVFDATSDVMAGCSDNASITLWRTRDCSRVLALHELPCPRAKDSSLAFSPDGSTIGASCMGTFRQWSVGTGELLSETTIPDPPAPVAL